MNRIYRVIWSQVKHGYVVVSEMAKSRTKGSGSRVVKRTALAALVLTGLCFQGENVSVYAADNIVVDSSNITGTTNKVADDSTARVVGTDNTVENSANSKIIGDNNIVSDSFSGSSVPSMDTHILGNNNEVRGSRKQNVIGDNNKIIGRDVGTVTDYGHPEGRETNISDLTIGRGNVLTGANMYRNEWDSLTVIGNNNSATVSTASVGSPAAGIVIGDNQNIGSIEDSVVIGSLSPSEQDETSDGSLTYSVKGGSSIIGYHTSAAAASVAIGNYSHADGNYSTITGIRSNIESRPSILMDIGAFSSTYGAFNRIQNGLTEDDQGGVDGFASTLNGALNTTSNATGTMIVGASNTVTHSAGSDIDGIDPYNESMPMHSLWSTEAILAAKYYAFNQQNDQFNNQDAINNAVKAYMANLGGSVAVLGNSNTVDYSIRSQIIGTANDLKGSEAQLSSYNTVSGYANQGTNVSHTAIVGTGNTITNSEDNVILGDYHVLDGGKRNVVLGSMAATEEDVTKQYASLSYDGANVSYVVKEMVPTKHNTSNLENAVMLGYNTDVTENGGVALGAQSTASTAAGAVGYDPKGTDRTGDTTRTWKSTLAAVSVGDAVNKLTRQITGVAAGTEATDAVNVAQLQEAVAASGSSSGLEENSNALSFKDNTLSLSIKDKAGTEVTGSVNLSTIASAIDTRNTLANADGDSTISIDSTEKNDIGGTNYKIKVNTDGKVESGNTGIVTGGTVYNETRVSEDGTYVKKSKSAGDNLTILDSQVASNTTQITTNTNNITNLSNQVTDISDNVTNLNGRVSNLDTRINRVGAGAAALAALHPQDYDPTAKWDFAAGYGNYKSANAVAIGAFYRPTNDVLFSIGTSMGGGENMFNAGVSFKFGSGNEYSNYSKASLAAVVSEQASTIGSLNARVEKQEQENEALRAQVEKQAQENAELRTQVQDILRQLANK